MSAVAPRPVQVVQSGSAGEFLLAEAALEAEAQRGPKRAVDRAAYLSSLVYQGKQRVFYAPRAEWYFPAERENRATTLYHPRNYYRFLVKSNLKEYLRSMPVIRARAAQPDSEGAEESAEVAGGVWDDFRRRFRTDWARQVEFRRAQNHGNFAVFIEFDPAAGKRLSIPDFEEQETAPERVGLDCLDCGYSAEHPPEAVPPECPECQSPNMEAQPIPAARGLVQTGVLRPPAGDWVVREIPILELSVSRSARDWQELTDVLWLRWHYEQPRALAEWRFGCELSAAPVTGGEDGYGARYQTALEAAKGGMLVENFSYGGAVMNGRLVAVTEEWFRPEQYARYRAPNTHEFIPGKPETLLEQGQPLTDLFPSGLRYVHSGNLSLAASGQAAAKHFAIGEWDNDGESFWGAGAEDAVAQQFELNEMNAIEKTHARCASMPTRVVRSRHIRNAHLLSNPSVVVEGGATLPDDMPLEQLIYDARPSPLSEGAYRYKSEIKEGMQESTGALNNFNGADQKENRTATQTSILEANALAHSEAVLGSFAATEKRIAKIAVDLWKENSHLPRAFEVQSDHSEPELRHFSSADLSADVEFEVETGTVLPRRPYQEADDTERYLAATTSYAVAMKKEMPAALADHLAKVFHLPAALTASRTAARVAKRHLEALRKLAEMGPEILPQLAEERAVGMAEQAQAAGLPPEAGLQAGMQAAEDLDAQAAMLLEWSAKQPDSPCRVLVEAHLHPEMAVYYANYLNGDRGAKEEPLTVAIICGRIREHILAEGKKRAILAEAELIAQGPQMQAMMAMQPPSEPEPDEDDTGGRKPPPRSPRGPTRAAEGDRNAAMKALPPPAPTHAPDVMHREGAA